MDENLYDEFGNYIGPALSDSEIEGSAGDIHPAYDEDLHYSDQDRGLVSSGDGAGDMDEVSAQGESRIVLHEDKKYYPDAEEVYPGVRTVTLDEDAQDIDEPIIKPIKVKNFSVLEKESPSLLYSTDFLTSLMNTPLLIRNIAIIGNFHHGKTMFVDTLIQSTHSKSWEPTKDVRYTDSRKDEQQRELSIKSTPVSLVLESLKEKSFLFNIMDCPGHINFADESTAALRITDGAILVVDAVEGVMMHTEQLLRQAIVASNSVCLVINKIDRLVLELKLPPADAYFKLMHTIEDVNKLISTVNINSGLSVPRLSPELGNVCFSSAQHGWSFTLQSFAEKYRDTADEAGLAKRLWGDWFFDPETRAFCKRKPGSNTSGLVRTFVQFVLEPIYKLYSQVIGESPEDLVVVCKRLGVALKNSEMHMDPKPLLRIVMSRFFGNPRGFVDMVIQHVQSPTATASAKVSLNYSGLQNSSIATVMRNCDSTAPLVINIVKLYNTPDGTKFLALGRIYSGTIRIGQRVKVLGESYSTEDDEDMCMAEVLGVYVPGARFSLEITSACAGNIVLLDGVDDSIKKTATIVDLSTAAAEARIFRPLQFEASAAVMKVAVEPLKPSELPKLITSLRRINKSYPCVTTKVEESGEHVILGTGELYMDCVMHDLRHLYADLEVKVADPSVAFCETVVESSAIKCFSETPNKRNRLTLMAEPLENGLAADIERGAICLNWNRKMISDFFQSKYDWDLLASRSVWAFGPDSCGPNLLMDDTLPSEVDKSLLGTVRESIIQGFKWGCREGPLCDEPLRNTKFKILDAAITTEPLHRGGGQVIPTARRVVYSSFLMATPRLMEPVYAIEIQAPADAIQAIYPVLARRRGHIVQDAPKPGAPFYVVRAFLPVMDSFGFETDLRSFTQGQAFCQQVFDHWAVVPGDPLDKNVILHPLEPSPPPALARDFMVKTRRRKGLSEDVSISKYFDDPMLLELAKQEVQVDDTYY